MGAKSAFAVVDPGLASAGVAEPIFESLAAGGIIVTRFTEVQPNPIDIDIEKAAALFRSRPADVILAVGGGSSLDTAKGIAMLVANGGRVRDYDGNDRVPQDSAAVICIPTTAGTGSEVSANISVTNCDTHEKMAIRSRRIYPRWALLDPSLLSSLPAPVAAAAGMDALVHAVESYTSNRSNAFTRMLCREATRRIALSLEQFVAKPSDASAAAEMQFASCLAGMPLFYTGTGAAHAIARALGGYYNVVHGVACSVLLEPVMRFNLPAVEARYAELADAMEVTSGATSQSEKANAAIVRVRRLREAIGIPDVLDIEVSGDLIDKIATWAAKNCGPNPRPANPDDIRRLIVQAVRAVMAA